MKRFVMGLLSAILLVATTGQVAAGAKGSFESRAAFVEQLDKELGIAPVHPARADFKDVPQSSPYYGYIEAAYAKGFISGIGPGTFGPAQPLTRAQAAKILVAAYGAAAAAQAITATNFQDNGQIPSALVGYVGEAAALGLMTGVTKTTFDPKAYLSATQMVDLLRHLVAARSVPARGALRLVAPSNASFSEDKAKAGVTFGVAAVDAHGNAVPLPSSYGQSGLLVTVWDSAGQIAPTIMVDGHYQGAGGYESLHAASGSFTLTDDQSGPDAGTYTVQISDPTGALAASGKATFTETAGALNVVSATDPAILYSRVLPAAIDLENGVVPLSDPSRAVTAQLSDAYGNPIAQAGVPIYFDASDGCSQATPTLAGQGGVLTQGSYQGGQGPVLEMASNAQGQATATVTAAAQPGYTCLDLWSPATPDTDGSTANHGSTEVGFTTVQYLTAHLAASFSDGSAQSPDYQSQTQAVAGDQVGMTITATDQAGNPAQGGDIVQVTFSKPQVMSYDGPTGSAYPGWLTINRDGSWDVLLGADGSRAIPASYFTLDASGSITATLEDISLSQPIAAQAALQAQPGPLAGFGFRDRQGADVYSGYAVQAGAPLALQLAPIDAYSDWTTADRNYIVDFTYEAGQFRLSPQGQAINQLTVQAGSGGTPVYFVSPVPFTTYEFGWHAWVAYQAGASLDLHSGQSLTFSGDDWQGQNPGTPSWSFAGSHQGSLAAPAAGGLQDTYTAPASGQGTDEITYQDPAGDTLTFAVSY